MTNLKKARVMVTGADSMVGRHVVESLGRADAIIVPITHEYDLTSENETYLAFELNPTDYLIHLAGYNGGIEFNRLYPADIFENTARMALNVLTAAQKYNIKKTLSVIASCSYPDGKDIMKEEELWSGPSNKSVECHGLSKRILDAYSRQLNKQYGNKYITAVLTNCFGPHDRFDPTRAKVVGALIRKFVEAKAQGLPAVECWGTGAPLRQFMFVKDAADCLVKALVHYEDHTKPLNIGNSEEITIKQLVELIVHFTGYEGNVKWLVEKGDGQMRKMLETTTMNTLFEWDETPLAYGIEETIDWYIKNKEYADRRK